MSSPAAGQTPLPPKQYLTDLAADLPDADELQPPQPMDKIPPAETQQNQEPADDPIQVPVTTIENKGDAMMETEQQGHTEEDVYDDSPLDGILISYSGKDAIKEAWERRVTANNSIENAKTLFDLFRSKHQLQLETIEEVLVFLEAAGITRNQFARVLLSNLIHLTKQRIRTMSQTQLTALLDKCYTYLTVPELAPIAISTLEHLKYVRPTIWTQIVANGVQEAPYVDLPLALKHRIWAQESTAFDHEIDLILERVLDAQSPTWLELETISSPEQRKEWKPVLKDFLSLVQGLTDELLAAAAEKLYEKTCMEGRQLRRVSLADLFHDFLILAPNRSTQPPLADIRKYAKVLSFSSTIPSARVSESDVERIYVNVTLITCESRPYFAYLLSSSISRDFLADQLILQLWHCRGDVGNGEDEQLLKMARQHLRGQKIVVQLIYLLLYNIKGMRLLINRDMVLPEEVDRLFDLFLPLLIGEMYSDLTARQCDYSKNLNPVSNPKLIPLITQGKFERRVIASYCLFLARNQDFSGLFRQRLLLDAIISTCDPREESREFVIAKTLFQKLNDM